jgi:hypothetical protein
MTPTTTAETTYMIDVSGTSRSYIVTLPANYNASQPHQLVFAWHGRTGTAMQIARGNYYGLKSRMTNAIFVAGQGLGTSTDPADTGWPNTNGQDIAFVRAALAWMNSNYCVDQARVFSVGFSYGGIMSHTIACQMSDTFRAVAPMAGATFGRTTSCLTHPIAAWMTHGTMDTSASGGVDFTAGESARDRIVTLNHCTTTTMPVDPSPCVALPGLRRRLPGDVVPARRRARHPELRRRRGRHLLPPVLSATAARGRATLVLRSQRGENLGELVERLAHPVVRPEISVESVLRGIELVQDDQRLAALFLEGHRGDGAVITFLIGPYKARVRCHFDVLAEERLGLRRGFEQEFVSAPDTNVHLAREQGDGERLRYPPPLEQLGIGPRLEHEARRAVEGSRDDQLAVGLPFHRRGVLHGSGFTFSSCVHRSSPFFSDPR